MTADKEHRLGIWPFSVNDPVFNRAGEVHDWHYADNEAGLATKSREQVDEEFRNNVNRLAKGQGYFAKWRGEIYKFLATRLGRFFW